MKLLHMHVLQAFSLGEVCWAMRWLVRVWVGAEMKLRVGEMAEMKLIVFAFSMVRLFAAFYSNLKKTECDRCMHGAHMKYE